MVFVHTGLRKRPPAAKTRPAKESWYRKTIWMVVASQLSESKNQKLASLHNLYVRSVVAARQVKEGIEDRRKWRKEGNVEGREGRKKEVKEVK